MKGRAGRALRRLFYGHCRRGVGFTASPLQPALLSTTLSTQTEWKDEASDVKKTREFLLVLLWWILVLLLWCFPVRVSYQGEALGRRRPPLHRGERPLLNHVFGPLVHSHHTPTGDAQEPRHHLALPHHLSRKKKKKKKKKNFKNQRSTKTLLRKQKYRIKLDVYQTFAVTS